MSFNERLLGYPNTYTISPSKIRLVYDTDRFTVPQRFAEYLMPW